MTIQTSQIILPLFDNNGIDLVAERLAIKKVLLDTFGGYTCHEATGAWKDPATLHVYEDPSEVFSIAGNWTIPANVARLRALCELSAEIMRQECIYMQTPKGVEFVQPRAMPEAA